jgi:Holliday junction resolvase RusA-like endonuclease
MIELELILPWPSKDLSPNARVHWTKKAKAAREARNLAYCRSLFCGMHGSGQDFKCGRIHLWIDFYPPTKRLPDDDNMLSRCKAYRDGIADALGIDDKRFVSHPFVKDEVRKGGQVVVRITGGPEC